MSLFITFEGCEGCGKSYQAKILYKHLLSDNVPVVLTFEPGGTSLGNRVRHILKQSKYPISPETELFLFSACRAQLMQEVIQPALMAGKVVICDRFVDSTTVYQGYGRGLDLQTVFNLNAISAQCIQPDLTILLDIPVEAGLGRKKGKKSDRFDSEEIYFHNRIREGYLILAELNQKRWYKVDAGLSRSEISNKIWKRVYSLLRLE